MLFAFFIIPFTYFWYEAKDAENPSVGRRCWDAWKVRGSRHGKGTLLTLLMLAVYPWLLLHHFDLSYCGPRSSNRSQP
jgi:hypothetical protein